MQSKGEIKKEKEERGGEGLLQCARKGLQRQGWGQQTS